MILKPVAVTKDKIEGHDRQGRFLEGRADLHAQVRGRVQGGWHPVGRVDAGRRRTERAAGPSSDERSGN